MLAIRPLLWLLLAVVWFGTLGLRDLVDPDEGRYSEISREMALSGDWVTPRLNGLKYFEKPPLQYWATAIAFRVFGVNEFSARLWVGLCGFATVVLLWFTARRLWGGAVADCTALIAGSTVYIVALGHVVTLDMGVSFFLTLALCGFLLAQHDGATTLENHRYMWLTWAAMAGAALSKGLIGVAIPGAVLVLYSIVCRDWVPWRRMQWLIGLIIFFALALPWHLLAASRNPEWAEFYFVHEHFARFLTTEHHRVEPWYFFVPLLILGFLPWSSWLPATLRLGWAATSARFQTNRFLLIWAVSTFAFFSASGSKLPAYILPIFPALVLLLAQLLARVDARVVTRHGLLLIVFWFLFAAAAFVFGDRAATRPSPEHYRAMAMWLLAGGFVAGFITGAAVWIAKPQRAKLAVVLISLASFVFLICAMFGYQAYAPLRSSHHLAELLRPTLAPDTPVFSVNTYDQTFPYYLNRTVILVAYQDEFALGQRQEPERSIATVAEFAERWKRERHAIALMSHESYRCRSSRKPRDEFWWRSDNTVMKALEFALVLTGVLLNAVAQLLLKAGARNVGAFEFSFANVVPVGAKLIASGPIIGGLGCYVVSVVVWILALSRVEVSIAYPMLSIGYVVNAGLAWWLFGEAVTPMRLLGIAIICIGVFIVARS
jgi:4-amino-4-deoxy-L-arabinose transferase-like glycosyltransferase/multidrug transporter EmrE-like cation transporter